VVRLNGECVLKAFEARFQLLKLPFLFFHKQVFNPVQSRLHGIECMSLWANPLPIISPSFSRVISPLFSNSSKRSGSLWLLRPLGLVCLSSVLPIQP
jgi:hypothetical protein